jgi:cadmium resistance protein CadD (predicted permease)
MDWLPLVLLGITAFAATNLDDILLLVLFFGNNDYHARDVFLGQVMGIGLLVIISLILSLVASAVPQKWLGILGLVPVLIGARELIARRNDADDGGDAPRPNATIAGRAPGQRRAVAVAGVTLANGGDNIGVYTPLFAVHSAAETLVLLVVFAVMTWLWLNGAYYLVRRSAAAGKLQRAGHAVFPYALILLGLFILVKGLRL